jgi:hypothetical protein
MNAVTGLKPNSKPPKTNKQKRKLNMPTKIYFWYMLGGIVLSSALFVLQPSIKSPLWFGVTGGALLILTAYLMLFKTFSFSVGKVPMLVAEENSDEYKTVSKNLKDNKPFSQLPSSLKTAHTIGLFILWALFIATTVYLIYVSL